MTFFLPGFREPFFDRRVRWWEPKVRYSVGINCSLKNASVIFNSEIINISLSGVFLKDSSSFKVGDVLNLNFNFLGSDITLPVKVVHKHTIVCRNGCGVQFCFKSFKQSVKIAKIINVLRHSKRVLVLTQSLLPVKI